MSARALAALHAAAFPESRPWSAEEFSTLMARPETILVEARDGFAIGRLLFEEAELLSLAVAPAARRAGLGRRLLAQFETEAKGRGATRALLEVAEGNLAALTLYRGAGWRESARRKAYYPRPNRPAEDALILEKRLT